MLLLVFMLLHLSLLLSSRLYTDLTVPDLTVSDHVILIMKSHTCSLTCGSDHAAPDHAASYMQNAQPLFIVAQNTYNAYNTYTSESDISNMSNT